MNSGRPWDIKVRTHAQKALKSLPHKVSNRLVAAIELLSGDTFRGDIKKMYGEENVWRCRVGAYRILYELFPEEHMLYIANIERRASKTY